MTSEQNNDPQLAILTSLLSHFDTTMLSRIIKDFELVKAIGTGELTPANAGVKIYRSLFEHYGEVAFQQLMEDQGDFSRWYIEVGVEDFRPLREYYQVTTPQALRPYWHEHTQWYVLLPSSR